MGKRSLDESEQYVKDVRSGKVELKDMDSYQRITKTGKYKKRSIAQIKADKSGNRTKEEVKRLDAANTRKGKLYKSIMNAKPKKKEKDKNGSYE